MADERMSQGLWWNNVHGTVDGSRQVREQLAPTANSEHLVLGELHPHKMYGVPKHGSRLWRACPSMLSGFGTASPQEALEDFGRLRAAPKMSE